MFAEELLWKIIWIMRDKLLHICTSYIPLINQLKNAEIQHLLRHKYDQKMTLILEGKQRN